MPIIRLETPEDVDSIRYVNDQAFGQEDESKLTEKLRKRGVLTISLVAVQDSKIVGHIAFSPVVVESEVSSFEAITLDTYSHVAPGLQEAAAAGFDKMVLPRCEKQAAESHY